MSHQALPLLLEPEALLPHLGDNAIVVIDLSSEANHQQHHVPGARYVSPRALVCGTPPAPGKLPSEAQLNQLFSDISYSPDTHYVVYDDEGGGWAGRFIWTLDVIGHNHYSYLNGGLHAWLGAQLPTESGFQAVEKTNANIQIHPEHLVTAEEIISSLDQPDFLIWDARSPQEYSGQKVVAQRGGHIPGAVNCEWTLMMDPNRHLKIRQDAKERLAALGIDESKQLVTHCQSHHRSGFTYLLGKILGFSIRAYDGSWSEWGNREDTPIEV